MKKALLLISVLLATVVYAAEVPQVGNVYGRSVTSLNGD